jgi:hypothetical protein
MLIHTSSVSTDVQAEGPRVGRAERVAEAPVIREDLAQQRSADSGRLERRVHEQVSQKADRAAGDQRPETEDLAVSLGDEEFLGGQLVLVQRREPPGRGVVVSSPEDLADAGQITPRRLAHQDSGHT